jgi:tRNA-(ms[2]io[6]A)-hydroxylase
MSILRSATDPRWVEVALSDLDATLADHAHCEKKAAASALKLVADHPDRPELVRSLAKLAQEELQHLLAVLAEMARLGVAPTPDAGDPYAQALVRLVRGGAPALVDRLLVSALIEARSCERLAKRHGALSLGELRARGADPRAVVGLLAELAELAPAGARLAPRDLVAAFSLARIRRAPAVLPRARVLALAGGASSAPP